MRPTDIRIRVTAEEKAAFEAAADGDGMTVSAWARRYLKAIATSTPVGIPLNHASPSKEFPQPGTLFMDRDGSWNLVAGAPLPPKKGRRK